MPTNQSALRDVQMLALPVELQARAEQWHEDLMREFALIDLQDDNGQPSVPSRLLALVTEMRDKYEAFGDSARGQLAAARERGDASVDVTYTMPADAADAVEHFDELLDEADAFCRRGDLLTLAAPAELAAFRRWFLHELTVQLRGGEPTPWPRYQQRVTEDTER